MQFQRIVEAVYFQPWSITWPAWRSIHAILKPRLAGKEPALKSEFPDLDSPDKDIWGNSLPKIDISLDGVATIPIFGPLIHHASLLEKKCGACSYADIAANVYTAINTPGVRKIVYNVASSGGMCMGSHETAKLIDQAAALVPSEAFTDSAMCSAAYDIVCGIGKLTCTDTAIVGSIGTLLPWLDESVRYEMEGFKMEVIASGPLKGTGVEGTKLSDAQRAYLQSHVDKYAGMFKEHVRSKRIVEESTMQGQAFIGSDAMAVGLVDAIL